MAAPAIVGEADRPETPDLRFGMIALTDCSPIVIAHEKGFFKKYGINATIVEGRELGGHSRLALERRHPGHAHADRHAASLRRWACSGSPKKPMVIPWLLNRNGQAITLKTELKGKVGGGSQGAEAASSKRPRSRATPMTFAMTFPPGTHAMWMRYFLAAGGIIPTRTSR